MFGASTGGTAFGSTGGFGTSGAFGTTPASTTNTFGTGTFGSTGGFGAPASTSSSSFGNTPAFGAPAATSTPAFGSTNTFGSSTANKPFGSFGTTNTFGATTSSAFGNTGSAFGSAGSAFGSAGSAFGNTGSAFGGLQQQQQQQQLQQQQQQQLNANSTENLLNAIMRCSMFGDDRDGFLARWNLLQASWGVGKAYFAPGQQPLALSNENPLCRFKAIGYSAVPKTSADGLTCIVKKKPAEVEKIQAQIVADLQAALGNRPNIKVVVDSMQPFTGDQTELTFRVVEQAAVGGATRTIGSSDVYNALSAHWPALQQRHAFDTLAPRIAFVRDQLAEYTKHPPAGVDPRLWKQAALDNPDASRLAPVPLIGFRALQQRLRRQEQQAKIYQGRLDEIARDIGESQKRQQANGARLRDAKRKQLELAHRVLDVITRQEATRKLGFTIQMEEERLRVQLEALQAKMSAPTQFKGRLNELLSQVRLQQSAGPAHASEQAALVDQFARQDIKALLRNQQDGLHSLVEAIRQDLDAIDVMHNKLAEATKQK